MTEILEIENGFKKRESKFPPFFQRTISRAYAPKLTGDTMAEDNKRKPAKEIAENFLNRLEAEVNKNGFAKIGSSLNSKSLGLTAAAAGESFSQRDFAKSFSDRIANLAREIGFHNNGHDGHTPSAPTA